MSTGENTTPDQGGARRLRPLLYLVLFLLAAWLLSDSVIFVDETEYVISERLGHIVAVYDQPKDRGLHFKLPWPIGTVRRFDRRVQLFDPRGREVFTSDKKNITVDAYICWKIAESPSADSQALDSRPVVRFFRSFATIDRAHAQLDSRVRAILSTEIGKVELSGLLNVEDPEAGPPADDSGLLDKISKQVQTQVEKRPDENESIRDRLGIEIVDVRIKRINLPAGNQQAVFERMKSERRKIADRYRSAGLAENTVIKSHADRQYNEILARANADAERIRGEAEAEAISILNRAHSKDREFYKVVRTLDTYRTILNERTTLVLSASSNLLKMLTEGIPEIEEQPAETGVPEPRTTLKPADDPANPANNSENKLDVPKTSDSSAKPAKTEVAP